MKELQSDGEVIGSARISVVIQGLTHYVKDDKNCLFYQCIDSIKKYLPYAEIIVSTWEGQNCDESVVDKVLYNDEPESIMVFEGFDSRPWNFNKMVFSTMEGLKYANREYTLKIRADLSLSNNNFFKVKKKKNIPDQYLKYKFFEEAINVSNLYTKNPLSYQHFLFHLGDVVQFGLTRQMKDLWGRKLFSRDYLFTPLSIKSCFNYFCDKGERLTPEQALMVDWVNSKGYGIYLPYTTYISKSYFFLSEIILSLNFNIINWEQTGFIYPERFISDQKLLEKNIYKSDEINLLYYRYYNVKYINLRLIRLFCIFYFTKFFRLGFLEDFVRTFLIFLSPKVYLRLRRFYRLVRNKNEH